MVKALSEDPLKTELHFDERPIPSTAELPRNAVVVAVKSCAVHWVDLCAPRATDTAPSAVELSRSGHSAAVSDRRELLRVSVRRPAQ